MVILKSPEEIEKMRASNAIVAEVLALMREIAEPGITTLELDRRAEEAARSRGSIPAFKGYGGFPFSLCTSINEEVVHGFPSKRELKEGDIASLDFGVCYNGYFGDSAVTIPIGSISESARRLMQVTKESLDQAIENAVPGNRLGDISNAVQRHVESAGFSPVRDYVGHGIGKNLHEDPPIPNFGPPGRGILLKAGMVIAIEPMINAGTYEVDVKQDGWTVVTRDGKLSAHFEHTLAITDKGPRVLSVVS
ncbi:MAG: methionine aminopeptidase [delta proteobacterium MLS_D]|jgi:methionyl aminopeptidase|nr:MAG: methionine aminopeptidase [delta proteobacterium MLS_D]